MVSAPDISIPQWISTPNFLRFPAVGLNISDHSVKMMDLRPEGDKRVPARFDALDIPDGAVVSGDIKDREVVSGVLSQLQSKHNLSFARFSIPEENGYIFNLEVPSVEKRKLREAVSLRLDEKIPITTEEAVFDYDVTNHKDDGTRYITVSALPADIVGEYMQICREANLSPLSFEIEAQTIARAVVSEDHDKAVMVIDIGKSRTGISIVNAGTVEYTSTIQIGGDQLTEAVAEATDRSVAEAETYKQEHGFIKNSANKQEFAALSRGAEDFVDEAVRRFRYWYSDPTETVRENRDITRVLLCGGNASVPGLADHISAQLDVPVRIGDVWKRAFDINEYIPEIDFRHSLTHTSAIGLALSNEF
jgi:type IV pilus assembly protein PilM